MSSTSVLGLGPTDYDLWLRMDSVVCRGMSSVCLKREDTGPQALLFAQPFIQQTYGGLSHSHPCSTRFPSEPVPSGSLSYSHSCVVPVPFGGLFLTIDIPQRVLLGSFGLLRSTRGSFPLSSSVLRWLFSPLVPNKYSYVRQIVLTSCLPSLSSFRPRHLSPVSFLPEYTSTFCKPETHSHHHRWLPEIRLFTILAKDVIFLVIQTTHLFTYIVGGRRKDCLEGRTNL